MMIAGYYGIALLFLGIGLGYYFFPPKGINHLYGYRTKRSMANEDVWRVANDYSRKSFLVLGILLLVLAGVFPYLPLGEFGILAYVVVLLIGLFVAIYRTERHLNTLFDTKGNRL